MKSETIKKVLIILLIGGLMGCSTKVSLNYTPSMHKVFSHTPLISVHTIQDHRKHDPCWLGAIRGGFGNPLKVLETSKPVKYVVRDNFISALQKRELLTSLDDACYYFNVNIEQFDCNQIVRREAHVKLDVDLIEKESENTVFSDSASVDNVEGSSLSLKTGIFASKEDLRKLAEKTLNQAIDNILNNRKFLKVIKSKLHHSAKSN